YYMGARHKHRLDHTFLTRINQGFLFYGDPEEKPGPGLFSFFFCAREFSSPVPRQCDHGLTIGLSQVGDHLQWRPTGCFSERRGIRESHVVEENNTKVNRFT